MERDDPAWIALEYQKRRRATLLWRLAVVLLAFGVSAALPLSGGPGVLFLKILLVIALAFSVWRLFAVWHCPRCEGLLGRDLYARHCPTCGVKLEL